jgi:hypothetical protein
MYSYNKVGKPRKPPLAATRLLDQLSERLRYMHYSLRTEQTYVYWVRWYIRWHELRHPKEMGGKEVEAFLSMLANERRVSPSTHRQALSASGPQISPQTLAENIHTSSEPTVQRCFPFFITRKIGIRGLTLKITGAL